ncbi:CrcB family protein [Blautia argi]
MTFSTFALESSSLMKQGKAVAEAVYMALSVGICLAAVMLGQKLIVR